MGDELVRLDTHTYIGLEAGGIVFPVLLLAG